MENMCAAGLTYLLARAATQAGGDCRGWCASRALLLAGLATYVDVTRLTGINRVLLKHSLRLANLPIHLESVPGLAKLRDALPSTSTPGGIITEETYGFYWGPVINAAGRMASAMPALELLLATSRHEAEPFIAECLESNRWRKAVQKAMLHEAQELLERGDVNGAVVSPLGEPGEADSSQAATSSQSSRSSAGAEQTRRPRPKLPAVLTLARPTWHPGVVGVVAGELKRCYGRPVIVSSLHPATKGPSGFRAGIWKGSARSVPTCDMGSAIKEAIAKAQLRRGGGHYMAAGLEFTDKQRPCLHQRLAESFGLTPGVVSERLAPIIELAAAASSFSPDEWAEIFHRLSPFGNGNPIPPLIVEAAELLGVQALTRIQTDPFDCVTAAEKDEAQPELAARSGQPTEDAGIAPTDYWAFLPQDVRDAGNFLRRLREQRDPVAQHLYAKFDAEAVCAIDSDTDPKGEAAPNQLKLVLKSLNRIMGATDLYDSERFRHIKLQVQTTHLLKQNLKGKHLIQLNRALLEDAFPGELRRLRGRRLPQVYAYEGQFQDRITGRHFFAQWLDFQQAEIVWQVHRFIPVALGSCKRMELPIFFRLELELRAFVPSRERSNIYRRRSFEWRHGFQIRQCIPIKREERFPALLRMPIVKD